MPDSLLHLPPATPLALPFCSAEAAKGERMALGVAAIDGWLAGGLRRDALHEAYTPAREDAAAAMALALLVAWLNQVQEQDRGRAIIWARELSGPGLPYGPGLIELGIDPQVITLLLLPDSRAVLRAALDSVRQGAASAVLIELRGRQPLLDLTATRRLALAAQDNATMVWLVRGEAQPMPSAAQTRWQVGHANAGEMARPAFNLTLLRQRGGRDGFHICMEWDRDTASFQPIADRSSSPLSGPVPAMAADGAGATYGDRAA